MRKLISILFLISFFQCIAQKEYVLDTMRLKNEVELRGLSVVNDEVVWMSGNNGFVCRSVNGGQTFDTLRVKDYEKSEFRDIEAFDDKTALILSAGVPAVLLRTIDGGIKWKVVYSNSTKGIFFNGMDFWDDKRGIAFSDPVDGKLFIIATVNGGINWKEIPYKDRPTAQEGEVGFAASGTSIRTVGDGYAYIGTGGRAAHIFTSDNYGKTWKKFPCPIKKGGESAGVFSVAFKDLRTGVIAGGDFKLDTLSANNCFLTYDGANTWKPPLTPPKGYRSCVEYLNQTAVVAVGPNGTDYSRDGGNTWKRISKAGFNVVRKAKTGNRIWLAGSGGLLGMLTKY